MAKTKQGRALEAANASMERTFRDALAFDANDVAFCCGPYVVLIKDVAVALAVQQGQGEAMVDMTSRAIIMQDARDILDRAYRYARDRK